MSYVLVHLVGDEATQCLKVLVDHVARAKPAAKSFRERHPDHGDVKAVPPTGAVANAAVCFAHGSELGLGAEPGHIWADAQQLGDIFSGKRVYAHACQTLGGANPLGRRAVEAGVAVFVGHDGPIMAELPGPDREAAAEVAGAPILLFLDGVSDAERLRAALYDASDELIRFPIHRDARAAGAANAWTQSMVLEKLAKTLTVHLPEADPGHRKADKTERADAGV